MAIVTQTNGGGSSADSGGLLADEFLPIVKFKNPSRYTVEDEQLIFSEEDVTLSKYLDSDKQTFTVLQLTTNKNALKLPFSIKKGITFTSVFEKDDDGYIEPQLSINDENFKIISDLKILKKYGDEIEVELNLKGSKTTEFYLDFFANDDEDDFIKGDYENVHCGRIKIIYLIRDPKTFSEKEFNNYKVYILRNESLSGEYGYAETDKHDCVTAINRSLRKLFSDNSITPKKNMDDQMREMINTNYAIKQIEIEFQDSKGKKTNGASDPHGFLNKKLTEVLNENLTNNKGYYFFGMSIMDGYHSVMIVVNKTNTTGIEYNIFDQHGSVLGNTNSWYDDSLTDKWLIDYVSYGNITRSGEKGMTTTTITQIKHKK